MPAVTGLHTGHGQEGKCWELRELQKSHQSEVITQDRVKKEHKQLREGPKSHQSEAITQDRVKKEHRQLREGPKSHQSEAITQDSIKKVSAYCWEEGWFPADIDPHKGQSGVEKRMFKAGRKAAAPAVAGRYTGQGERLSSGSVWQTSLAAGGLLHPAHTYTTQAVL